MPDRCLDMSWHKVENKYFMSNLNTIAPNGRASPGEFEPKLAKNEDLAPIVEGLFQ
jgi:hypothetical protein